MKKLISIICAVSLASCATTSGNLSATYVSPLQYQAYDCEQLTAETMRIHARVSEMAGNIDSKATSDKVMTGVGVVLFWPALFFLGGNKQQQAEYSRLKGEFEAIQQQAVLKKCAGITPPK